MVSSVEEKMMMSQPAQIRKNNNNNMIKFLGATSKEIKRFGKTNQTIRRKMR